MKSRRCLTCIKANIIYLAYSTKCGKQGVGSTKNWKPRLSNYKSNIKSKDKSCSIVKHFIDSCTGTANTYNYLRKIILIGCVSNTENSTQEEIDDLLLKKENFCMGTLCTIHKGLNDSHYSRRVRRNQSLTSMIGNTAIKLIWIFSKLDLFS